MGLLTVIVLVVFAALLGVGALVIAWQILGSAARSPSDDQATKE